jgi:general secretion pathway protein F/type IV pilus assembly protein PilC
MPSFAYTARNGQGEKVAGTVSAASQREVLSQLAAKSLFPLEIVPERPPRTQLFGGRIKGELLATTYSQLAALLRSGVPLLRSLNILREQISHPRLKSVLDDVHRRVEEGSTLAEAMQRHESAFGELAVQMVRAGGEGGFLEDALQRIARFTENQEDLKGRTMGALTYPFFLIGFGSLVVAGLMIFFVPSVASMFDELRDRGELPPATEVLLWISETMRSSWYLLLGAIVGGVALLKRYLATSIGRRHADRIKIRLPLFGVVYHNLAVARFCRVLGTLIHNGVPILKALEISRKAAGNVMLSEAVEKAAENITAGESLSVPLSQSGYFPRPVCEMISVAEESNTLDQVLVDVADGLERRTERRLDVVVRLLEPLMLVLLAAVVLFILIALLMPIMKMGTMF